MGAEKSKATVSPCVYKGLRSSGRKIVKTVAPIHPSAACKNRLNHLGLSGTSRFPLRNNAFTKHWFRLLLLSVSEAYNGDGFTQQSRGSKSQVPSVTEV